MYDRMSEQAQAAFKPMNDLFSLNTEFMKEAAEKQRNFFNDIMNDSIAYGRELGSQKDFSGVYQVQKSYLEGMQERLLNASTDTYEFITKMQERASEVVRSNAPR
jgi:phasin family protein